MCMETPITIIAYQASVVEKEGITYKLSCKGSKSELVKFFNVNMSLLLSFIFDHQCSKVPHFKCSSGIELLYTSEPIITCLFLKESSGNPYLFSLDFFIDIWNPLGPTYKQCELKKSDGLSGIKIEGENIIRNVRLIMG